MSTTESESSATSGEPPSGGSLIGTTSRDRCSQCGAELASDQRYCVECGHRRGRARFSLDSGVTNPAPVAAGAMAAKATRSVSSTVALIASVGVLLLAMGVGVLIGHNNSGSGKTTVLTVGGGAAAASAPAVSEQGSTASSGGAASSGTAATPKSAAAAEKAAQASAPKTKAAQEKAEKAPPSKKAVAAAAAAATAAASLSTSKTGKAKIAAPTAKLGSKCSAGTAGCSKSGKLNGSFFGG